MSCGNLVVYTDVTVYLDHENAVIVIPYSDIATGTIYDMTDVTRVVANADPVDSTTTGDSIVGDSAIDPLLVLWDEPTEGQWRIIAKVGRFTNMVAGQYLLRLTLYSPAELNGYVLPDTSETLRVTVQDIP